EAEKGQDNVVYTFRQIPAYSCETGICSKSRYGVCGDICESFSTADTAAGAESGAQTEEKIIKTVDLTVQTKEYDTYISALEASVLANSGYVETSESNSGGYYNSNRRATYTVRIPADKLDAFLTSANENGKIVNKTENQQNVTLEYVDLESRISAYKTEQATLTGLLEKAESLENVLSIQERLSEVNYQIESYTAQLRVLENRVSYSTVTLRIDEVERVTETEPSLWERIKNTFIDNVDELGDWLSDAVVAVIGGLPIILPAVAAAAIAIIIIRKLFKKRKARKQNG
ncbi:MAG: DUF4349 domain-containing protein, partial [Clostridia bacterium]|nr:DUF4349 domain-containing protein [Clostridia bacterium]